MILRTRPSGENGVTVKGRRDGEVAKDVELSVNKFLASKV